MQFQSKMFIPVIVISALSLFFYWKGRIGGSLAQRKMIIDIRENRSLFSGRRGQQMLEAQRQHRRNQDALAVVTNRPPTQRVLPTDAQERQTASLMFRDAASVLGRPARDQSAVEQTLGAVLAKPPPFCSAPPGVRDAGSDSGARWTPRTPKQTDGGQSTV